MIIYKITNTISGKIYVGQTIRSLETRFNEHCHKIIHYMPINRAIQKYGKENFKIEKICDCSSIEELNKQELYYTNLLNSWAPHGYNLIAGNGKGSCSELVRQKLTTSHLGHKHSEKSKKKLSETLKSKGHKPSKECTQLSVEAWAKMYSVISPTGEILQGKSIRQLCIKYGLNPTSMTRLLKGKQKSHKGWRLHIDGQAPLEVGVCGAKEYWLLSPNDERTHIINMRQFCIKHDLNPGAMSNLVRGARKSYKGWRLFKK